MDSWRYYWAGFAACGSAGFVALEARMIGPYALIFVLLTFGTWMFWLGYQNDCRICEGVPNAEPPVLRHRVPPWNILKRLENGDVLCKRCYPIVTARTRPNP